MRRVAPFLLTLLVCPACIQQTGLGPELGPCSDPPDRVHTYGEVGIGTCLSGPADMLFLEQGGATYLAVSNANPFLNFESGSVLLIDWDSIDLSAPINRLDTLDAWAEPMDSYVGGLGYASDPFKQVLLVAGRLSEDARTRTSNDELWVLDVSDPTDIAPWPLGDKLVLKDDPQPVVIDEAFDRAYVGNITDHSISVLDTSEAPIRIVDVAPGVDLGEPRFFDDDGSGSRAELVLGLTDAEDVPDDLWTLRWVDAAFRLWVPEDGGLRRWNHGGGAYVRSGFGVELDPADTAGLIGGLTDPSYGTELGAQAMLFSDRGTIWAVPRQTGTGWDFGGLAPQLLGTDGAWNEWVGGPSMDATPEFVLMLFDGRIAEGEPASIGLAIIDASGIDPLADPILEPSAPYVSFEDPHVRFDDLAGRMRAWISMWDGSDWTIGLSETVDVSAWPDPVEVLAVPGMGVAAPVLAYSNGRYRMWLSLWDGASWSVASAWSWDGIDWSEPEVVIALDEATDPLVPPRVALQADTTGGFSLRGANTGDVSGLAVSGSGFTTLYGFAVRVANNHELSGRRVGDSAINGVIPVSAPVIDARQRLYLTTFDDEGRSAIAAVERSGDQWAPVGEDMIPSGTGGNVTGASAPVVAEDGDGYVMIYAAFGADGVSSLRRATSDDGIDWSPATLQVPVRDASWESGGRVPHALEPLEGGGWRLWYAGSDAGTFRIGAMTSSDGQSFVSDPGLETPWQLGLGTAGTFDDSGVYDPVVVADGDTTYLWYTGFDGDIQVIGLATRTSDEGAWRREPTPLHGVFAGRFFGISRTFSAAGVRSPVLVVDDSGPEPTVEAFYAGTDGASFRVGRALGTLDRLFPAGRFPTVGDRIEFSTQRGDEAGGVIELRQCIDGFCVSGQGTSTIRLDEERGFLYVAAKRTNLPSNFLYVVDVRDDSVPGFLDRNYLDIEAILAVGQTSYASGFRDVIAMPGTDIAYATGHNPENLTVFDLSALDDRSTKRVIEDAALASVPLLRVPTTEFDRPYQDEDVGADTDSRARFNGAGMAIAPDGTTLLITLFRENTLIAFDTTLGAWGEEVARVPTMDENPHMVRVSPDGRHAVVANYLGEVDEHVSHSTLSVVDIDPASPTYLQVVTRITNR